MHSSSTLGVAAAEPIDSDEFRRVIGHFAATGVIPRMVDDLRDEGVQIPAALFQRSEEPGA